MIRSVCKIELERECIHSSLLLVRVSPQKKLRMWPGAQVDDCLMENIAAALSDRESGAMEKTILWDDLHVTRGKAEQLEARLRRQAIEDEVLRWNT